MKSKGNLMYRLLKIYSLTLLSIITLFSISVSWYISRDNVEKAQNISNNSMVRVASFVEENQKKVKQLADKIRESEEAYQGLSQFFSLNTAEYLTYTLENNYNRSNIGQIVKDVYLNDENVTGVQIDFELSKETYVSNIENKYGSKETKIPKNTGIKFSTTNQYRTTGNLAGVLYLTVSAEPLTEMLSYSSLDYTSDIFLISERNQLVYTNSLKKELVAEVKTALKKGEELKGSSFEDENFVSSTRASSYQIISLVNRKEVANKSRFFLIGMLFFSILIDSLLLFLLYRLFNGYAYQVEDIVSSVNKVSIGERYTRLDLTDKEAELKDISVGINDMLESLDAYIRENYELEIRQKEADFRALQAQINPHFMYNTLEYIRMYALSEGMVELSEVVFAFASILRNNISHKKMISLESEMKFVEQYVYLYQMRYPKSIAYSFKIDDGLKKFELPKFCLQPLVENYFAHGVDFTRTNNVISVYAQLKNGCLAITIADNGKGMAALTLSEINDYLAHDTYYESQSIGIRNVNERLKIIFGDKYKMSYKETVGGGTTVGITIELEGKLDA